MKQLIRLNKFIANNSEFSRRKADELIVVGKVFVNDQPIKKLGLEIDPQKDRVKINNKIISKGSQKVYFALNKPAGFITTRNDELNRQTVMDLLPKIPNLRTIGRLDKETEGLLLASNDGEFVNRLSHPKFKLEKEYFLRISRELSSQDLEKLQNGVKIDERKTSPAKIRIIGGNSKETSLTITIREGRNRQIRKMFASLDYTVKYLQRIRVGNIELKDLKKGQYRPLTAMEINAQQSS